VRIINEPALERAKKEHPEWAAALDRWADVVEKSDWKSPIHVTQTLGSKNTSMIGGKFAFDIAKNTCRLVASINYKEGTVTVRDVLTHKKYDKYEFKRT
jgi:mRNA interferase HigB